MSNRGTETDERDEHTVNWRQTNGEVTLYEPDNPDAWIRAKFEAGVAPEHRLYMVCPECGATLAQRCTPGNGTICGDCGTAFDHGSEA